MRLRQHISNDISNGGSASQRPRRLAAMGTALLLAACGGSAGGSGDSAGPADGEGGDAADSGADASPDAIAPDSAGDGSDAPVGPKDAETEDADGHGEPSSPFRVMLGPTWLLRPSAIAFEPAPAEGSEAGWREGVWVGSAGDDAFVVLRDPGTPEMAVRKVYDYHHRFVDNVRGLAFSETGEVATCADADGSADGAKPPDFLVGPALWPSDVDTLAARLASDPQGGFLERFRTTPLCMGMVAAGSGFYTFNGQKGSIDYAEFQTIHPGPPQDGKKIRIRQGALTRVEGVPAGLAMTPDGQWLYVADAGLARVVRLDTQSGTPGSPFFANPDSGTEFFRVDDMVLELVVGPGGGGLVRPAGLAPVEDGLVVADHGTGHLRYYGLNGEPRGKMDTGRGPGALGALAAGPDGALWFTDMMRHELVRIEADAVAWEPPG